MYTRIGSLLALFTLLSPTARSATIIPVVGGEAIGTGTGFENIPPFFDAQPGAVPTSGPTIDLFGSAGTFYANAGRGFFINFGSSYASITVSDVYVGLKVNGTNSTGVGVFYFWSSDINVRYDPLSGDTPAPDFNLFSFTASTSAKSWQQIYNGADVVPAKQYYIGAFSGGAVTNRLEEIVFVSAIPEPSTAGLAAATFASFIFLSRRRGKS
ncbi:hypothetical protein OKA05_08210 [Luteolibacter arcticus]|uniref:PEP-CTERM protein-sorting domain-containing protein n=1 Tax=Luteolibacter arcticus TaxID=1581411 RepID=A0ABT3GGT5_9BACT|nr:hypothetical protein [Luteolibacter arcticus]MCW1922535.1 hypothetical protein [Luteolibacter arcticus]